MWDTSRPAHARPSMFGAFVQPAKAPLRCTMRAPEHDTAISRMMRAERLSILCLGPRSSEIRLHQADARAQ
jgi:hypothetical protein